MSTRIHTGRITSIEVTTVAQLDEQFGYEHTEDEADNEVLVLFDSGNQEIWVVTGDVTDWFNLAAAIKTRVIESGANTYDPHGNTKHRYYEEN